MMGFELSGQRMQALMSEIVGARLPSHIYIEIIFPIKWNELNKETNK